MTQLKINLMWKNCFGGKISEWEQVTVQKHQKNTIIFFWKKMKHSSLVLMLTANTSSINASEQTARDKPAVEVLSVSHILLPHQLRKLAMLKISKTRQRKPVNITEEIKRLEDVRPLQLTANLDETCATLKSKKVKLKTAIEKKKTLKCNCINKKLYREQQKEENKAGKT